ncbi:glutaminyl-peptide cyclotransferase [Salinivirga cyanobacteriivorans]
MPTKLSVKSILIIFTVLTAFATCNDIPEGRKTISRKKAQPSKKHLDITKPKVNYKIVPGKEITFDWKWKDVKKSDSVVWYANKTRIAKLSKGEKVVVPKDLPVGIQHFILRSYLNDKQSSDQVLVEVLSEINPEKTRARIVQKLYHDPGAYTQGLEIHKDFIYESTGQYKESSMRKIDIETGKVIDIINLKDDIFGEGMTVIGDKIYQLTWQSNTGFVYDVNSFKQLYEFVYPTEGWGLTNDGESLIMSDGSYRLYYIDREYFTETRQISVYDQNGPVSRLNELEYINDKILANVYGEDFVLMIDPATGKVLQEIDLSMLKEKAKLPAKADVLNGIAWDADNEKLYATGKYWPVMFEITVEGINR